MLWEAADRVCGKRLKALIPTLIDAMERHGHLDLDPVVRSKLLQVSAATIVRGRLLWRSLGYENARNEKENVNQLSSNISS